MFEKSICVSTGRPVKEFQFIPKVQFLKAVWMKIFHVWGFCVCINKETVTVTKQQWILQGVFECY